MNRRAFFTSTGVAAAATMLPLHRSSAKNGDGIKRPFLNAKEGSRKGLPDLTPAPRRVLAGLEPYVPSPQQPWNKKRVAYLLRRTMFGAKREQITMALQKTPAEVVDMLLADQPSPSPPSSWINENYTYNQNVDNTRIIDLRRWWISLMLDDTFSFREKMVLFWHDHFATEWDKVRVPQFNYILNDLFRQNAYGNFKALVKKVTTDPCMLFYLDGQYSTSYRPNENYGRELQELFTLGIYDASGNPNYTEQDIQNASKALTGWIVRNLAAPNNPPVYELKSTFTPSIHDAKDKTFHGKTITGTSGFEGAKELDELVDILFQQTAAAEFICRKIYREFVYETADETIIKEMAAILRNNNFEMKPVLSALFKSAHFFADENIGSHIQNPMEFAVGICRSFGMNITATSDLDFLYSQAAALGMQIFDPPNVKGWPAYRTWISSALLPSRYGLSDTLVDGKKTAYKLNKKTFAALFPNPDDAEKLVRDVSEHLITIPLSDNQINKLLDELLKGAQINEWTLMWTGNDPSIDLRLGFLLRAILRLSENQLC